MIKTILSDIGNVLVFVKHPRAGLDTSNFDPLKRYIIHSKINKYEKGEISTQEFFHWVREKIDHSVDPNNPDEISEKIFSLNGKMVFVMHKLKKYGLRLVTLSNTNEANYNFLVNKYDVFDIFDDQVLSYEVGSLKPENEIYKVALEKAQCRPEECIFIDDRKEFIKPARKLGINAIQYDHKNHNDLEKRLRGFGVL